jgi:RNA polymerase sigma factor (TIGR02999 family)
MTDITQILSRIEQGDPTAREQLLPLLYNALRKLAARHLAGEKPDQTLQPTALVHEAYLRLVGETTYSSRGQFFMAASRAMRQILIDNARRKKRIKHGGNFTRQDLDLELALCPDDNRQLLALNDALTEFSATRPRQAQLVELRFFGGMTLEEAAETMGVSLSTADRDWKYARAWLHAAIKQSLDGESPNSGR